MSVLGIEKKSQHDIVKINFVLNSSASSALDFIHLMYTVREFSFKTLQTKILKSLQPYLKPLWLVKC